MTPEIFPDQGKVYLVGAGPGAPDLITVRGAKILKKSDVLLYDRLVHPDLLLYAPPTAKKIYVGKKAGENPEFRQSLISELMINYARRGNRVVRLKGGDSFVFGRGGEEALTLQKAGIAFEIIPGITAAIGVPESAGIPVTHRTLSSSFAVFAGRESDQRETLGIDWEIAAQIPTAIFLMGVERLPQIVAHLVKHGRTPSTPVAVIARGTLPDQEVITGTLEDILEKSSAVSPPATIIVGEVVQFHEQFENLCADFSPAKENRFSQQAAGGI